MGGRWDEDDPVLSQLTKLQRGRYEDLRDFANNTRKKYGTDRMSWNNNDVADELDYAEDGSLEINDDRDYSKPQLEAMADLLLRDYGKKELCRECLEEGKEAEGKETGHIEPIPQFEDGVPVVDGSGNQLYLDFPEMTCDSDHKWYLGEGKARGHGGENPVLFEEHLAQRKRREIYTTDGTPDPNIVSGMYNRIHPQGRKVNTDKQRKEHGASFYR